MVAKANELRRFGERLRKHRIEQGWSQEALGARAGIDRTHIGKLERGQSEPGLLAISRLAAALGIRVATLVEGEPGD